MKVEIRVVEGPEAGISFVMEKNGRLTIGRGDEASVQLAEDELLSRQHFQLDFDGQILHVIDLGSTNGTFVDGKQILPNTPAALQHGQTFIAGRRSKFEVSYMARAVPITPPTPTNAPPPQQAPPPNSNFGSSFYQVPTQPGTPPTSGPTASEGNFSQSVRQDFSEQDPLLGNFGSGMNHGNSGSQMFRDGIGDQRSADTGGPSSDLPPASEMPPITPPSASPPPTSAPPILPDPPAKPPGDSPASDYGSSIAAPGMQGVDPYAAFPPVEPIATDSKAPPEVPPRMPTVELPGSNPPSSNFASVPPSTPISGPEQAAVTDNEMKTPSTPPPQTPSETPATYREPVPTPVQQPAESASPFDSISGIGASVASPGGPVYQQPPTAASNEPPAGNAPVPHSSIGMPGHYVEPAKRPTAQTDAPPPVTQKASFQVWQTENGLFFHGGTETDDLAALVDAFRKKFEALYTLHVARTEMEFEPPEKEEEKAAMVKPGEKPSDSPLTAAAADDEEDDSPFADDSPFSDSIDVEAVPKPQEEGAGDSAATEPMQLFHKIGDPLFHWLPKEARWGGPVLLEHEELPASLAELWDQDAIVGFFGGAVDQVSGHLKSLVRTDPRSGRPTKGMFGFCWPSVMQATLETQPEKSVGRIFDLGGISAILFEDGVGDFAWVIVGKSDLSEHLFAAGFARV